MATIPAEPVSRVVDTTAAGDSFAAAYLAARRRGEPPAAAARAGHRLAAAVIGHHGAIIARTAMPPGLPGGRDDPAGGPACRRPAPAVADNARGA